MENKKLPKIYTITETYAALVKWTRSVGKLMKNRRHKTVGLDFVERLMLAVTEVNGCAICAYGHTQMALNQGFTQEEISAFLSGNSEYIKPEEMKAILFAQHYADTKGHVDKKAYQEMIDTYGDKSSSVILAAIQMMMVGNILGLPISALQRRLKSRPDPKSSLIHEIGLPLLGMMMIVPALIHGLVETMMHQPGLCFAQ